MLAALDSVGVPIPAAVDALLLVLSAQDPARGALCAVLALAGSMAGSLVLYWLARRGGEAYLARHSVSPRAAKLRVWFQHYGLLTVFISAISPIPLPMKLFVICAGALGVRTLPFFLTVFSARTVRYAALAYLGAHFGHEGAGAYIKAHAWQGVAVLVGMLVIFYAAIKVVDSRRLRHQSEAGR